MRNATRLVLSVLLLLMVVSMAIAGPSKPAIHALDDLNEILDEILGGLNEDELDPEDNEFGDMLAAAFSAFEALLEEMPLGGLLFPDLFSALYDIQSALAEAEEMFLFERGRPYAFYDVLFRAQVAKDALRWSASGGLIQSQLQCEQGNALVMVYPGFDCHALRAKLNELRAAGKCVTVGWQEPICYEPDPNVALDGPTVQQLFRCFGTSYPVGPTFKLDPQAEPGAPGFSEYYTFGDPDADCHVSEPPTTPHAAYVDSTLALDVSGGEPTRYDPNHLFSVGDVLKPWYKVKDVRSPLKIDWMIYFGLSGTLAHTDSSTLNPANFNTDCLSNFSSAGWLNLDSAAFGTAGTYTAELWLGGTHCANHTFQMAGSGNQPPFVNHDIYTMDEDFVLEEHEFPLTSNDLDPNSDPLMTTLDEGPYYGTLDLRSDGTFTYTPNANYYGVDWFTSTATDPLGLSGTGDVTILVNPVNDPPVANDDYARFTARSVDGDTEWLIETPQATWTQAVPEGADGTPLIIPAPGLLMNDTDPDREQSVVSGATIPPGYQDALNVGADGSVEIEVRFIDLGDSFFETIELDFDYSIEDTLGLSDDGRVRLEFVDSRGEPL